MVKSGACATAPGTSRTPPGAPCAAPRVASTSVPLGSGSPRGRRVLTSCWPERSRRTTSIPVRSCAASACVRKVWRSPAWSEPNRDITSTVDTSPASSRSTATATAARRPKACPSSRARSASAIRQSSTPTNSVTGSASARARTAKWRRTERSRAGGGGRRRRAGVASPSGRGRCSAVCRVATPRRTARRYEPIRPRHSSRLSTYTRTPRALGAARVASGLAPSLARRATTWFPRGCHAWQERRRSAIGGGSAAAARGTQPRSRCFSARPPIGDSPGRRVITMI